MSGLNLRSIDLGSTGSISPSASGGITPAAGTADLSRASDIQAAVGQFLESLGGGLQSDKALRMMLGLLILMAMLDKSGGGSGGASQAISDMAGLAAGGASATSIEIRQSSTIIVASQSISVSGMQMQGSGGSLDTYM